MGKSSLVRPSGPLSNIDGGVKDMPSAAGCAAVFAAGSALPGAGGQEDKNGGSRQPSSNITGLRVPGGEGSGGKEREIDCSSGSGVDQVTGERKDRRIPADIADHDATPCDSTTNTSATATVATESSAASVPGRNETGGFLVATVPADDAVLSSSAEDTAPTAGGGAAASDDAPLGADQTAVSTLLPISAAVGLVDKLSGGGEGTGVAEIGKAEEDRDERERGRLLQLAEEALTRLYETHDNFFSSDTDEKKRRLELQAQEVMEVLPRVDGDIGSPMHERARVSYIRGRALDVFSDFNPEAEKCLASAVKLQPSEPDSWTALGHCYWKKPDLFAAKRCFLTSLEKVKKADAMRQLSMLLRQLPGTPQEANGNLQESLRLAKEAVTLDMGCGDSWYVLGNAYVASFFRNSRGIKDLDRALQAYKKAESTGGRRNPDLFFNRAHVFHYREDYPEAIRDYRFARELDPLLPVGSTLHAIETGVKRLAKLVKSKGGLEAKRLSRLVASLGDESARRGLDDAMRLVGLRELRLGRNAGVAVALKVVMPAEQSVQPPERLVVVDHSGECAVLSLYSVSEEACKIIHSKDTLVVKNPSFRSICLSAPSQPLPPPPSPQTSPPTQPVIAEEAAAPPHDPAGRPVSCGGGSKGDSTGLTMAVQSSASKGNLPAPGAAAPPAVQAGGGGEARSTNPGHSENGSDLTSSAVNKSRGGAGRKGGAAAAKAAAPRIDRRTPEPGVGEGGAAYLVTGAISMDAAASSISYPGIQCDPSEILLNGETMKESFVPPAVRLATFDK